MCEPFLGNSVSQDQNKQPTPEAAVVSTETVSEPTAKRGGAALPVPQELVPQKVGLQNFHWPPATLPLICLFRAPFQKVQKRVVDKGDCL